ncbi:hypothetical protein [Myroides odoratus]|uniref:Ig-like domain-containing protein n=1 Tax=Myroides odoratus TaxID=256 RepID=A0A378RKX7_MYROD|nr:hypothetical protein [Myroides odoratus]QQU04832.1 hypothetical protein I6I89_05965 [Myroides odoratus]STZ27713.1 Uncharacterised protein [Myroides odoratus]
MNRYKIVVFCLICILSSVSTFGASYYWVGGSGDWSDINHWRTSSGGTAIPGVIPGPSDDVFFDDNAGFSSSNYTITLNVAANCRNITVAGTRKAPRISGSASLNIYGSSVWQSGMSITTSIYYQDAGQAKTITSNGVVLTTDVYLNETTAVALSDDFSTTTLYVNAGVFDTKNHRMDIGSLLMNEGTAPRELILGNSEVYIGKDFYDGVFVILHSGTSTIYMEKIGANFIGSPGHQYNHVFFQKSGATISGGTATDNLTFNRVDFLEGSSSIKGENTFKELFFAPGVGGSIESGATQTITHALIAKSDCSAIPTFATTNNTTGFISMPSSALVDVSAVKLQNITAIGGAIFNAVNAIDFIGNTGWTFTYESTSTIYWVGGSGNWGDKNHWSFTSGGPGGACIPTIGTNVIFDENSRFTTTSNKVYISTVAYCNNITFSGAEVAPNLEANADLNIYGSSVWQTGMTISMSVMNTLTYRSTGQPKTLTSHGVKLQIGKVNFDGTDSFSLLDDFNMDGVVSILSGTWNTNGHRVDINNLVLNRSTAPKTLQLGNSELYIKSGFYDSPYATIDAGTSHIYLIEKNAYFTGYQGHRYYNLTFLNPDSTSVKLQGTAEEHAYFNTVTFKGGGYISSSSTIRDLMLTPGKTYYFYAQALVVKNTLEATAECDQSIELQGGSLNTLYLPPAANVKVSNAILTNVNASGGEYLAVNSVDNGGNTGWIFSDAPFDLYWVGGAGDWNDTNHWAFTSGGIGGACAPGLSSNVFFDANSGFTPESKTITIKEHAVCRDITFAGSEVAPSLLALPGYILLDVYGSSVWQRGMSIDLNYLYYKNLNQPKTITSNGVHINTTNNVTIEERSSVSLLDDLDITTDLKINAGVFNTNDFPVVVGRDFYAGDNFGISKVTVNLGSSKLYMKGKFYHSKTCIINAGTSHIYMEGGGWFYGYSNGNYYDVTFLDEGGRLDIKGSSPNGNDYKATFNRVTFKKDGMIGAGYCTFNELAFTAGYKYNLGNRLQHTVKSKFTALADCKEAIQFTASNSAILAMPATATVEVSNVVISNIQATGGAAFTAVNSSDNGGNSGWNFTSDTIDLFWVGGSGDWNDRNHWSFTSGGEGGDCVPSFNSNVFFDEQSGFTSDADTISLSSDAFCNNIQFEGTVVAPKLTPNTSMIHLNIYGSSTWQAGMTVHTSVFFQNSNKPKTIKSNGVSIQGNVRLYEHTSVTFLDDFAAEYLALHAGQLNTANNKVKLVTALYAYGYGNGRPILNLGHSEIYVGNSFDVSNNSVTLLEHTSTIYLSDGNAQFKGGEKQYNKVVFTNTTDALSMAIIGSTQANPTRFNQVEFYGGGSLAGYNVMKDLFLAPGKRYTIEANATQTVTGSLQAQAQCQKQIYILSSDIFQMAYLSMPAEAEVHVSNVYLSSISAIGGAEFKAINSEDGRGNEGWSFVTRPFDLFWVGGDGNWGDRNHWSFTSGGAGGACVPSSNSNVFFDENSGASLIIIDNLVANCRDISFSGPLAPVVRSYTTTATNNYGLRIYGSSVWQRGMVLNVNYINYSNTGRPKTITSNGVKTGRNAASVTFYETTSISLVDDFIFPAYLYINAGTFNSNNFQIKGGYFYVINTPDVARTINLGRSDLYLSNAFYAGIETVTVHAGESHIHLTGSSNSLTAYVGQEYGDVTFEASIATNAAITTSGTSDEYAGFFNRVEFKGGIGSLKGNHIFKELIFPTQGTFTLQAGDMQVVESKLIMSGNVCDLLSIKSSETGKRAKLMLKEGRNAFNFVFMRDIDARGGLELVFGDKSTVASQNNLNISYETYNPGAFDGFKNVHSCFFVHSDQPEHYILSGDGFYGNQSTQYSWTKVEDPNFNTVIGTESSIDIRGFGYGTYQLEVKYREGCSLIGRYTVEKGTDEVRVGTESQTVTICEKKVNTLDDLNVIGEDIKWYATADGTVSFTNTTIQNGETYYVTQTRDGCESLRVPVTIRIKDCSAIYINPNIRMRTKK